MSLSLSKIVLSVHNHLHFLENVLAPPLDKFSLCPIYPLDQEVLTVTLDSTTFGADVWSPDETSSSKGNRKQSFDANSSSKGSRKHCVDEIKVNVSMKCRLRVEYVDFRFLARHVRSSFLKSTIVISGQIS